MRAGVIQMKVRYSQPSQSWTTTTPLRTTWKARKDAHAHLDLPSGNGVGRLEGAVR